MISSVISRLVILVFGTLYPAYASYKAVRTKDVKEYVKWMMYWIVFALFTCAETFTDVFLSFWFPFYYEIKTILVLWLLSPATKGSSILYRKFVHPMLNKREQEIDEYIAKAKEQSYHTVLHLGSRGVNYATNMLMQTAIKGGGGLVNQIRRSYSLSDLSNDKDILADANRNNKVANLIEDEMEQPDSPDPRLLRPRGPRGYSPRRSASGSGRVEMYFPEVDVDVRQHGTRPREPSIPLSHIRSTEDVSSGYSSAEPLYGTHHPTQGCESLSASREPLVRTSSVGSTRSMRTKTSRGGLVGKRTPAEDSEAWDEADDEAEFEYREDCFRDVPSSIPARPPHPSQSDTPLSHTSPVSPESPSPSSLETSANYLYDTCDHLCTERTQEVASADEFFPASVIKEPEEVATTDEFFPASGIKEPKEVATTDEFFPASGIKEPEEVAPADEFFPASGIKETEGVTTPDEFFFASGILATEEVTTPDEVFPSSRIKETKEIATVDEVFSSSGVKETEEVAMVEEFFPASGIKETEEGTMVNEVIPSSGIKETEEVAMPNEFFHVSRIKETEEVATITEVFPSSEMKETEEGAMAEEFFPASGIKETGEVLIVGNFFPASGMHETEDKCFPASGIKETEEVSKADQFFPTSGIKETEGVVKTVNKFFPTTGVTDDALTSSVEPVSCDTTFSDDVLNATSSDISAVVTVPALALESNENSLESVETVDNVESNSEATRDVDRNCGPTTPYLETIGPAPPPLEGVETLEISAPCLVNKTDSSGPITPADVAPPSPREIRTGRADVPVIVERLTVHKERQGRPVKDRGSTETLASSLSGSVVSLTRGNRAGRYHKRHAPSPPPEAAPSLKAEPVGKSPTPSRRKQKGGGILSLTSILPSRNSIGHLASFLPFWSSTAAPDKRSSDNLRIRDLSQSPKSGRKSSHH